VRQNLWDFLDQIQEVQYDGNGLMPLSIDQTNNPERDHEVAIMGSIFSRAAKTIVWLGTATEDVVKDMQGITARYEEQNPHDLEHHLSGLQDLVSRPYWARLWILQEYTLSMSQNMVRNRKDGNFGAEMGIRSSRRY
jgi:hypothetical protein